MTSTKPANGHTADGAGTPRAIEATAWASAITDYDEEHVWVRGVALDEAIGKMSFGGMVLLLWTGTRADPARERLFEACLAASVDHGPVTPSATAARTAASVRQHPVASLAAGLLTVTDYHGGAVTPCMELLYREIDGVSEPGHWAGTVAAEHAEDGRRVPGIGHRVHTIDQRAMRLLSLAEGVADTPYVDRVRALSREVSSRAGRPITVNIDGAVAASLCTIGLDAVFGTLAFAIARSAGLSAHIVEERSRERPMRTISPEQVRYDGPRPAAGPASAEED